MNILRQDAPNESKIDFVPVEGDVEYAAPEVYAGHLLEWAVQRHASDLFVSDAESSVIVSVRRMGRIEQVRRLAKGYGHKLQGVLRVAAKCDAGETLRPTEGRGSFRTSEDRDIDMRLSTMPTLFGMDVAVRLFDPENDSRSIDQLGFEESDVTAISDLLSYRSGLILVAGPVASGKSSTLYAALAHLNDGTKKIHTLEDPIERAIDGVMQSQVNLRAGVDFPELLSAVLRHSPDVIMVGEIRDSATAATAVRAGASGQLVMATIHAKNAVDAIDSLLQYDVPPKFVASSLVGVISQRLVRQLCTKCRVKIVTTEDIPVQDRIAKALGDQPPQLCSAEGCEHCHDDGYESLSCLAEVMPIETELRRRIEARASSAEIMQAACEAGMLQLSDKAALRVLRGDMTAEDANRVSEDPYLAVLARISRG